MSDDMHGKTGGVVDEVDSGSKFYTIQLVPIVLVRNTIVQLRHRHNDATLDPCRCDDGAIFDVDPYRKQTSMTTINTRRGNSGPGDPVRSHTMAPNWTFGSVGIGVKE